MWKEMSTDCGKEMVFVENSIFLKKGVDKVRGAWYSIKVASDGGGQEPETTVDFKRNSKKLKKGVDKP